MPTLAPRPPAELRAAAQLLQVWQAAKSERTREAYASDLRAFRRWSGLASDDVAVAALLALDRRRAWAVVERWREAMAELAPRTRKRRLSTLRSLVTAARRAGLVTWAIENPGPPVNGTTRDTRGPTPAQVAHVLASIREPRGWAINYHGEVFRDRLIIMLLHDSGLRVSEVCSLRWPKDVDPHRGMVHVAGKGDDGARSWWPISRRAVQALRAWVDWRGSRPGPLLARAWNPHPNRSTIYRIVRTRAEAAGYAGWSPHGLRHTSGTTVQRSTHDLELSQRFLRHASPVTTATHYIDAEPEHLRELVELVAASAELDPRHLAARRLGRGHPLPNNRA